MSNNNPSTIELQAALQGDNFRKDDIEVIEKDDQVEDMDFEQGTTQDEMQIINQGQGENVSDSQLFKKDFKSIVLLIILYLYQGFVMGFFLEFVRNYLIQEKNIKGEQIALIKSITWPFSIKFLWAPLMDTYYFKSLGKRKSYIVPAQFIISLVTFYAAFYFNDWMENADVTQISLIGLICAFLLTIQDIAVDSWSVTLLHEKNVAYASFSQSFGQRIGNVFGYQLFIYLSDEKLMNTLFNYEDKVLTPFSMCMMISLSVFLGTIYVIFYRKEEEISQDQQVGQLYREVQDNQSEQNIDIQHPQQVEQEGFITMIKNIGRFFKNKHILLLIMFLITNSFGTQCVDVVGEIMLLNKGFDRSTLATIDLCLIPITQVISAVAARIASKKLEFKIWIYCFIVKAFWNIGNYFLVSAFEKEKTALFIIPLAIMQVGDSILFFLPFISIPSFYLRQCDQSIGGTYITFLNSFSNLGRLWPNLLITSISSHVSFTTLLFIGSIYNVLIFLFWRKKVINLQESDKKLWLIKKD